MKKSRVSPCLELQWLCVLLWLKLWLGILWLAAWLLAWHNTSPGGKVHSRRICNTGPLFPSPWAEGRTPTRSLYLQGETHRRSAHLEQNKPEAANNHYSDKWVNRTSADFFYFPLNSFSFFKQY